MMIVDVSDVEGHKSINILSLQINIFVYKAER
jgi:hypothetical protein